MPVQSPLILMHRYEANSQKFRSEIEARSDVKVVPLGIGEVYQLE